MDDADKFLCEEQERMILTAVGYTKEKKILELKCWNHITTSEARRVFHLQNMKYSEAVKSSPASVELQDTVNLKFEALLQSVNDKFESLLQSVNEKFEKKQTAPLREMLEQDNYIHHMCIKLSKFRDYYITHRKKLPKIDLVQASDAMGCR
ncbi:hypothetical protein AVEN_17316-1 [Araneus ventricosus]|uniref:Uncharacterized protein n=1 Tax=Araneus ventricosus TaxID=182803 RepID=A0A4Y2CT52_ARAVE|nr:hypothetical protein AVEN_17316-1 [Araneus ventricosus]